MGTKSRDPTETERQRKRDTGQSKVKRIYYLLRALVAPSSGPPQPPRLCHHNKIILHYRFLFCTREHIHRLTHFTISLNFNLIHIFVRKHSHSFLMSSSLWVALPFVPWHCFTFIVFILCVSHHYHSIAFCVVCVFACLVCR